MSAAPLTTLETWPAAAIGFRAPAAWPRPATGLGSPPPANSPGAAAGLPAAPRAASGLTPPLFFFPLLPEPVRPCTAARVLSERSASAGRPARAWSGRLARPRSESLSSSSRSRSSSNAFFVSSAMSPMKSLNVSLVPMSAVSLEFEGTGTRNRGPLMPLSRQLSWHRPAQPAAWCGTGCLPRPCSSSPADSGWWLHQATRPVSRA